jgi:hypothetical protein
MFASSSEQTDDIKTQHVMQNAQQHIAAIFDSVQSLGLEVVRSTTEWDNLTCDEQMFVEQEAQSL